MLINNKFKTGHALGIVQQDPYIRSARTSSAFSTATTASWPSNYNLQQEVTKIFWEYAPQLTHLQLQEIMDALKNMNTYTQYWTSCQVSEISTRNSLLVQSELVKQNTSGASSIMTFSEETKRLMIEYTMKHNPYLSTDDIMGEIGVVEEIGTACMRYLTLDQYMQLRGKVVSAFTNNTKINGIISTTRAPTTRSAIFTTTTASWPSNYNLQQEVTKIFWEYAPQLTQSQLKEIMNALKNMNSYTQYWTSCQVSDISTRNSLLVQSELVKQNTSGASSIMRFSDETKQIMIEYTKKLNPNMSMDDIMGEISVVEEIGTACMRYLTLDQYIQIREKVVSAFTNNTKVNGIVSTTRAPTIASITTKEAKKCAKIKNHN